MQIEGFIICAPFSVYGRDVDPAVCSFGTTEAEAWMRFIGPNHDPMDVPTIIQRWHDKGWRLKKATLEVEE